MASELAAALRYLADRVDAGEVTGVVVAFEVEADTRWSVMGRFRPHAMMTALRRARTKIIATRMLGPSTTAVRAVPAPLE